MAIIEGKRAGQIKMAEKMILKNKPLIEIIEFSELPEKKIRELASKLSKELIT